MKGTPISFVNDSEKAFSTLAEFTQAFKKNDKDAIDFVKNCDAPWAPYLQELGQIFKWLKLDYRFEHSNLEMSSVFLEFASIIETELNSKLNRYRNVKFVDYRGWIENNTTFIGNQRSCALFC